MPFAGQLSHLPTPNSPTPPPHISWTVLHFHCCKLSVSSDTLFYKVKSWDYFVSWPESQSLFTDGHLDTFNFTLWSKHFCSDNVSWPMENNEYRAVNGSHSPSVKFLQRSENCEMTCKNLGIARLLSDQQNPQLWLQSPNTYMIFITYQ